MQQITIRKSEEKKKDGSVITKGKWEISAEDIIAIGAVIVAILVVFGMIIGRLPINEYTYGLAGLSLAGSVVTEIIKTRKRTQSNSN